LKFKPTLQHRGEGAEQQVSSPFFISFFFRFTIGSLNKFLPEVKFFLILKGFLKGSLAAFLI
jgi:hypothetical protein